MATATLFLSVSAPPSSSTEFTSIGQLRARRSITCAVRSKCGKRILRFRKGLTVTMSMEKKKKKEVLIWTENKQVMTAAVERGWNTFVFSPLHRQLAIDWSWFVTASLKLFFLTHLSMKWKVEIECRDLETLGSVERIRGLHIPINPVIP